MRQEGIYYVSLSAYRVSFVSHHLNYVIVFNYLHAYYYLLPMSHGQELGKVLKQFLT